MIFVYTSVLTKDQAQLLSDGVIDKGLAACVDYWPVHSTYMWKGEKKNIEQQVLMFTSHTELAPELESYIAANHPYGVPIIARTEIDVINEAYKAWVNETLKL